ncbi:MULTISPECIES: hypothetical protein [Enterococcus]|uniref:Uncharacterized protein n=1 Tax=Enterococcus gallinarum TaxID=1353 RepID=A0ABD4ZY25_ENTGA|nr:MULTISPECIES: hypothetical protein [Enterococcus]MBF0825891.1 hypothetical protein [Enterococcus faecalis]MBF0726193.1 hypothetical protein [Enterococcus gallinarum]MBF0798959.1 hypothetical protein [Enterococcus gallinarum]MBX8979571.1 hypothetical protein [Enterococcus gallinarum]MCR1929519.1 hypothetical protein [Enterococcus gallinarum]
MEKYLMKYGYRCVLFRKKDQTGKIIAKNYLITGTRLIEIKISHVANRISYVETGKEVRFREIERYIRLVFDKQGILIARRVSLRSPLRFTGKGMGKLVTKNVI